MSIVVPHAISGRLWLAAGLLLGAVALRGQTFDGGDFGSYRAQRVMIYFPPMPPALDRPVAPGLSTGGGRGSPPAALAPYICEFFYPQLATRLHDEEPLAPRLKELLDSYTTAKKNLLNELRAEVTKQADAPPDAREAAFENLARRQALRLAELTRLAEQLRRSLYQGDHGWGDLRDWHLGDGARRGFSPYEIAQVMRAHAFYQNNLLPTQRRLLLEVAVEISAAMEDTEKAVKAQPYLFFSPDPARITVPDDAPPEVAAKIAAYQSKKSALKKQLYDAVYQYDGMTMTFLHNPIRALADKQESALNELERLAEDIRRTLVQHPFPGPAAEKSPLPAALTDRVDALLRSRAAAQRETAAKAEELSKRHTMIPVRTNYRFEDESLKFVVMPARGFRTREPVTEEEKKTIDLVTEEFDKLAQEYANRVAEFLTERTALRKSAGEWLNTTDVTKIDRALATAALLMQRKDSANAYNEYRVAVFQPGLSLEQRRLLLDGAIQKLELPLPKGELQPVRRGNSW